jgi:hypothetical protein
MDQLREFLKVIHESGLAQGNLLGLLHVLIGRRITFQDGTVVSTGLSWRDLAALLKRVRWNPQTITELGLNPADLPPRDRQRFWYMAIIQAEVHSEKAQAGGDQLGSALQQFGYLIGPPPNPEKT